MRLKKAVRSSLTALGIACVCMGELSCNSSTVSGGFKKEAGYLYYLLDKKGGEVLKRDAEQGEARAKAAVTNGNDEKAMQLLSSYQWAVSNNDESPIKKRVVDYCHWETAHALGFPEPYVQSKPQPGDCVQLKSIALSCEFDNRELQRLQNESMTTLSEANNALARRSLTVAQKKLDENGHAIETWKALRERVMADCLKQFDSRNSKK